jgi:hypothetical protein
MQEIWLRCTRNDHYDVSNLGRVRRRADSGRRERVLTPDRTNDGYLRVNLHKDNKGRKYPVSVLICEAFNGPQPPGLQCAHGDGVRDNNVPANLRWATGKENHQDRIAHGTTIRGEDMVGSVLTEADVSSIRARRVAGDKLVTISNDFGVSVTNVYDICRGRTWKHLSNAAPIKVPFQGARCHSAVLTDDSVKEIRKLFSSGVRQYQLSERFSVSRTAIAAIVHRKTWRHL